jgi:membrane protein implicated in regulation of membrane protease activity
VDAWVAWIVLAALLAVGEVATTGVVLGPIALAAGAAAIVALVGGGLAIQLVVFAAVSLGSLLVLRPIAIRHLRTPVALRTGAAALTGARAVVLEQVDDLGGRVKIGGEVWTARSFLEGEVYEPGTRVEVAKIDGATALVIQ